MRSDEIKAVFDQQAASYDERWARTAPIRNALHFLLEAVFAPLPAEARVLCIGAGTGEEILHLAQCRPGWTFTAVEPSGAMLHVLRDKAIRAGIEQRRHCLSRPPSTRPPPCWYPSSFSSATYASVSFVT